MAGIIRINTHNEWHIIVKCTDGTYMAVQLVKFKMKFVFVLLVTAIQCRLSIGQRPMGKLIIIIR